MLPYVSLVLSGCGGSAPIGNQQWLGPEESTGWTLLFKNACDGTGAGACKKCMDLSNNGDQDNGTPIDIWDCNDKPNQQWYYNTAHQTLRYKANSNKVGGLKRKDTISNSISPQMSSASTWRAVPLLPTG